MSKNTKIANAATIIGVAACLAIATLPAWFNILVMGSTVIGCCVLTKKEGK